MPSASSTSDDTDSATFSPSPTEHHDGVSSDVVVDSTDDVEEVEHVLIIGCPTPREGITGGVALSTDRKENEAQSEYSEFM
jgi:hypothetical protein